MNKVFMIGRLTDKPELRYTNSNVPFARFTLAVNRQFSNQDGEKEADFINCLAWRKTAELVCNYLDKGSQIATEGRIQTGTYEDKDGNKRKSFDVVLDNVQFLDKVEAKKKEEQVHLEEDNNDPFADFGNELEIEDEFLD